MKYIIVEDGMCYKTDTLSDDTIRDCRLGYISVINVPAFRQLLVPNIPSRNQWLEIDIWEEEVNK